MDSFKKIEQPDSLSLIEEKALKFSPDKMEKDPEFKDWLEKMSLDDFGNLLHFCFFLAVFQRASDLHFKPYGNKVSVLLRKQGELQEFFSYDIEWYEPLLRILKNWSNLPSYKSGIPLEGRLCFPFHSKELFVRTSIFPTVLGEKVACRILNFRENLLSLDELGMEDSTQNLYTEILRKKKGMVVICGSAGSGKTTTLYASLLWLLQQSRLRQNISTIEDPVEFIIEEFNQTEVNPFIGLTFSQGLRSILRQDPNIIAVGEVRDSETALMAVEAGLTGHLIFTTLHAQGTKKALTRLQEFGASSSTVSMAVTAVLYQELVPKPCPECKKEGCSFCGFTGQKGLTGKFELLALQD